MGAWRAPRLGPAARTVAIAGIAVMTAACGLMPLGPRIEVPLGMPHRMSIDQVQAVVATMVRDNVVATRRELRPFRVTRITLVPGGQRYDVTFADGSASGGSFIEDARYWAVEADGTFRSCASSCSIYSYGLIIIDDLTGQDRGGAAREPPWPTK
jgi:hypothetical protein